MKENKGTALPKFKSVSELVNFADTHDMGDYLEKMPVARFDVGIKTRKHVFTLDEKISQKVTRIAKAKKIPSETLLNLWIREKVLKKA